MEDNFRLTLIIISAIAIIGIFAHGFWTLRKNKNPYKLKPEKNITEGSTTEETYDGSGFDFAGVGKPRVIGVNPLNENEIPTTPAPAPSFDADPIPKDYEASSKTEDYNDFIHDASNKNDDIKGFSAVPAEANEPQQSEALSEQVVEPEPIVEKPVYAEPVTQAKPNAIKLTPNKVSKVSIKLKDQVKSSADIKRDQLEINFGETPEIGDMPSMSAIDESRGNTPEIQPAESSKENLFSIQPEVIVLSVVAPEGEAMSGAMLLPSLLTLGLKFGEMDIFHRHEDNAGNGKVTFSLANIMNPGTFNLDEIETFTTQGISLFMTLPNAGESFEVFEKMLYCAKQLALEFKGQVLDDKRSVMTKQTEQHYMSRIRDFTRKHRIATL